MVQSGGEHLYLQPRPLGPLVLGPQLQLLGPVPQHSWGLSNHRGRTPIGATPLHFPSPPTNISQRHHLGKDEVALVRGLEMNASLSLEEAGARFSLANAPLTEHKKSQEPVPYFCFQLGLEENNTKNVSDRTFHQRGQMGRDRASAQGRPPLTLAAP